MLPTLAVDHRLDGANASGSILLDDDAGYFRVRLRRGHLVPVSPGPTAWIAIVDAIAADGKFGAGHRGAAVWPVRQQSHPPAGCGIRDGPGSGGTAGGSARRSCLLEAHCRSGLPRRPGVHDRFGGWTCDPALHRCPAPDKREKRCQEPFSFSTEKSVPDTFFGLHPGGAAVAGATSCSQLCDWRHLQTGER
jgi:hypothetical protein